MRNLILEGLASISQGGSHTRFRYQLEEIGNCADCLFFLPVGGELDCVQRSGLIDPATLGYLY